MPGDLRLRLELSFDKPSSVKSVEINFLDARGTRSVRWFWDCGKQQPSSQRKTYVLRPGKKSGPFKPLGATKVGDAMTTEIIITTKPRRQVTFTLHRVAAAATEAGLTS
jgi:hypothetical protein